MTGAAYGSVSSSIPLVIAFVEELHQQDRKSRARAQAAVALRHDEVRRDQCTADPRDRGTNVTPLSVVSERDAAGWSRRHEGMAAEEGARAMADVERQAAAVRTNMERLRALRQAREAGEATTRAALPPATKKKRKSPKAGV